MNIKQHQFIIRRTFPRIQFPQPKSNPIRTPFQAFEPATTQLIIYYQTSAMRTHRCSRFEISRPDGVGVFLSLALAFSRARTPVSSDVQLSRSQQQTRAQRASGISDDRGSSPKSVFYLRKILQVQGGKSNPRGRIYVK